MVPYEEDANALIFACTRKISTFLLLLKESGARSGEIYRLKWSDVDLERKFIKLNCPEKGSLPRQFKISEKLIAMLDNLPRQGDKLWGNSTLHQIRSNFNNQRNRVAFRLQNPKIKKIHFHSFRHLFASMEYQKSHDIIRVQQKLGHKSINNTMIYTHFTIDEFISRIATTREEKLSLIESGFEFVSSDPDGTQYFRKRK